MRYGPVATNSEQVGHMTMTQEIFANRRYTILRTSITRDGVQLIPASVLVLDRDSTLAHMWAVNHG